MEKIKMYSSKRIEVIDALRGFALMGILFVHFIEHFDASNFTGQASPVIEWINNAIANTIRFLFLGKAYSIFAMLFGLSFFIQTDNNAKRGVDFRFRFVWRLVLLYVIGHLNGLFYSGEILVVYALFGLILIPLYKVPVKVLTGLCVIFLFLIPNILYMVYLYFNPEATDIASLLNSGPGFMERMAILTNGSFGEVMSENFWKGQVTKWLYYLQPVNAFRIWGLFMAGLLIGKMGIYKNEDLMVKYAKRGVLWGLLLFTIFFCLYKMIPLFGLTNPAVSGMAGNISHMYSNLGMMFMIVGIFILCYFRLDGFIVLDKLIPVGRMSLTNYMMQSVIGALLFYGFGLGLATYFGEDITFLLALFFAAVQIYFSRWWLSHHYYGPVEWLWRKFTWISLENFNLQK